MYLKNFAVIPTDGKKRTRRAKIHYFNKLERSDIERSSTGKECTKPYFYDQEIETLLNRRIETSLLDTTFQEIITDCSLENLAPKQFDALKLFILVQANRTDYRVRYYQEFISWAKKLPTDEYTKSFDFILGKNLPSQKHLNLSEDFLKTMVKNDIMMAIDNISILKNFSWTLYINRTSLPFFTSDNPIINKSEIFFRFNLPIIQTGQFKERIYILPISSEIIVKLSKPVDSKYKFKTKDEFITEEMKLIMYINEIVRNAETKVYMKEKKETLLSKVINYKPNCLERKSLNHFSLPTNQMGKYHVEVYKNKK